jgi:hypothetical protein
MESAGIQPQQPVSHVVVAIIVTDHENRLAFGFQAGQNLIVENVPERWLLISCPLVEQIHWTIFNVARKQRKPLSLTL